LKGEVIMAASGNGGGQKQKERMPALYCEGGVKFALAYCKAIMANAKWSS
jgi:hypothetical protein